MSGDGGRRDYYGLGRIGFCREQRSTPDKEDRGMEIKVDLEGSKKECKEDLKIRMDMRTRIRSS